MLEITEVKANLDSAPIYKIAYNKVFVGDIYPEVDGTYVFMPEIKNGGFWPTHLMKDITNKLEELNIQWNSILDNDILIKPPIYKRMVILHGLPGSGKSTLAKSWVGYAISSNYTYFVASTDNFFVTDGKYTFDRSLIGQAHAWNRANALKHCKLGTNIVIVDNTNLNLEEIKPYLRFAADFNYEVIISEAGTIWKYDIDECCRRNTHGVPKETLISMCQRKTDITRLKEEAAEFLKTICIAKESDAISSRLSTEERDRCPNW